MELTIEPLYGIRCINETPTAFGQPIYTGDQDILYTTVFNPFRMAEAIEESEEKYIRMIFKMYTAGKSYNEIINALIELKGKRGAVIGKTQLYRILQNK